MNNTNISNGDSHIRYFLTNSGVETVTVRFVLLYTEKEQTK